MNRFDLMRQAMLEAQETQTAISHQANTTALMLANNGNLRNVSWHTLAPQEATQKL